MKSVNRALPLAPLTATEDAPASVVNINHYQQGKTNNYSATDKLAIIALLIDNEYSPEILHQILSLLSIPASQF